MDYITLCKIMSVVISFIGNLMIVSGLTGLAILGKAIYEAYVPEEQR